MGKHFPLSLLTPYLLCFQWQNSAPMWGAYEDDDKIPLSQMKQVKAEDRMTDYKSSSTDKFEDNSQNSDGDGVDENEYDVSMKSQKMVMVNCKLMSKMTMTVGKCYFMNQTFIHFNTNTCK